jgi:hypothetical protein
MATKPPNLGNIQGNILGGFNKDFQAFLFVKFKGAAEGRAWIKAIADADLDIGAAMSRGRGPRTGPPPPEGVHVAYPL